MARGKKADIDFDDEDEGGDGMIARAGGIARDNPVAAGGAVVMALTGCLIVANALSLQPMRHPAPLFSTRDRPQAIEPESKTEANVPVASALVLDVQREMRRIGVYRGPLDGLPGPATEMAIRQIQRLQGQPETGIATQALLAVIMLQGNRSVEAATTSTTAMPALPRPKPHAGYVQSTSVPVPEPIVVAPENMRFAKIQQLLADLGYGPLRADGVLGENTSAAIRRFELDRGLPITGDLGPKVIERLEMVSGSKLN
ncbi:peptidoglycan-binding domain-containing protein [Roseibium algae]|uniref:Peptidoglycan-binding domain-containing protein n=1 Tax=Roseibium algae TaxID=3123038 RepID=A0ABU8TJB1_9HYPH